jgi:hypothetical protein
MSHGNTINTNLYARVNMYLENDSLHLNTQFDKMICCTKCTRTNKHDTNKIKSTCAQHRILEKDLVNIVLDLITSKEVIK